MLRRRVPTSAGQGGGGKIVNGLIYILRWKTRQKVEKLEQQQADWKTRATRE